jgi:phosphoribosylaminoimidazole carboxylase PurE protein
MQTLMTTLPVVSILMGSENDLPVMDECTKVLEQLKIPFEIHVASAHRTPKRVAELASGGRERGIRVFVAGAGGAAHLAGVIAAHTSLPVIGVPIDSSPLLGLDALLATAMMPGGVPVATVAVGKGGARNAGILAAQILALGDAALERRLLDYRAFLGAAVEKADNSVKAQYRGRAGAGAKRKTGA